MQRTRVASRRTRNGEGSLGEFGADSGNEERVDAVGGVSNNVTKVAYGPRHAN